MNPNQYLINKNMPFVLAVAGGGYGIVSELTKYGGMSGVMLEASCLSDKQATIDYIGHEPDKFVSMDCSRQLALAAYKRAIKYAGGGREVFGVGVTSALVKEDERDGRIHTCYITLHRNDHELNGELVLDRTRLEEEDEVINLIRNWITFGSKLWFCRTQGTLSGNESFKTDCTYATLEWSALTHYKGLVFPKVTDDTKYIFPTAANPLHDGHKQILKHVYDSTSIRPHIEVCVNNVDKLPLSYYDIKCRSEQLDEYLVESGCPTAGYYLTSAPLFVDKARLFPNCVFVIGSDTFVRLIDPKYANNSKIHLYKQMMDIRTQGCSFWVIERGDDFVEVPPEFDKGYFENFFKIDREFRSSDISSTAIRKGLT